MPDYVLADGQPLVHARARQVLPACRDNYRGFFEQCFSQLLKQIFGYDGSSWLDQVAQARVPINSIKH